MKRLRRATGSAVALAVLLLAGACSDSRSDLPTGHSTSTATSCSPEPNSPGGGDQWGGCWPGPQNTGYPHGAPGDSRPPVALTPYDGPLTIRSCGVVIDAKSVDGSILVEAGNGTTSESSPCVVVRNSLVNGVIYTEKPSSGPVLIEDTEVHPPELPWWENVGRNNTFAYRIDSHGGEGVVKCESNCVVADSWIHGMRLGEAYHYNAVGGNGTTAFTVRHNYLTCGDWEAVAAPLADAGCSAVIGFYGDFGPIENITIDRNFLASSFPATGGDDGSGRTQAAYCLNPGYYPGKPFPEPRKLVITDNVFARGASGACGTYGPTAPWGKAGPGSTNVWSANRYTDGVQIARPDE